MQLIITWDQKKTELTSLTFIESEDEVVEIFPVK